MRFYLTNKQMKGNFRQLTKVLKKVPFEQSQQEITKKQIEPLLLWKRSDDFIQLNLRV